MTEFFTSILDFIRGIDGTVINFIDASLKCGFLDFVLVFFTKAGDGGIIWIILGLVLTLTRRYRKYGIILLLTLLCGYIFNDLILKQIFARPRPFVADPSVKLIIAPPSNYSFPSGHSFSSCAAATVLYMCNKKLGVLGAFIALMICFSRVYLYVHYTSDVVVGMITGIVFSVLFYKLLGDKVDAFLYNRGLKG